MSKILLIVGACVALVRLLFFSPGRYLDPIH